MAELAVGAEQDDDLTIRHRVEPDIMPADIEGKLAEATKFLDSDFSAMANLKKVLGKLLDNPYETKFRKMRRDVLVRILHDEKLLTILTPVLEYVGFQATDDIFYIPGPDSPPVSPKTAQSGVDSAPHVVVDSETFAKLNLEDGEDDSKSKDDSKSDPNIDKNSSNSQPNSQPTTADTETTTSSAAKEIVTRLNQVITWIEHKEMLDRNPESFTFADVMHCVQNQIELPGILMVEDTPQDEFKGFCEEEASSSSMARPKKPWETVAVAS